MTQHEVAVKSLQTEIPGVIDAFMKLHDEVVREGAISIKFKRLMLVAISVALRCEPCMQTHIDGAIAAGASREEIIEAAGVAILMAGGPAVAYSATSILEILDKSGGE